ncbi:hypothetical protein ACSBR1_035027 [Camellia fascicularis]
MEVIETPVKNLMFFDKRIAALTSESAAVNLIGGLLSGMEVSGNKRGGGEELYGRDFDPEAFPPLIVMFTSIHTIDDDDKDDDDKDGGMETTVLQDLLSVYV